MVQKGTFREEKKEVAWIPGSQPLLPSTLDSTYSQPLLPSVAHHLECLCSAFIYNPALVPQVLLSRQVYLCRPVLWCCYDCVTSNYSPLTKVWQKELTYFVCSVSLA